MAGATPITLNQLSSKSTSSEFSNFTFRPPVTESSDKVKQDIQSIQDSNNQILTQLKDVTNAFVTGKYKGKPIKTNTGGSSSSSSGNGLVFDAIDAFKDFKNSRNNKATKISPKASNWFNNRQGSIESNIQDVPKQSKQNFISDLLSGDKPKGTTIESPSTKGGILSKSKGALKKIPLLGAALSAVDLGMSVASGDANAIGGSIGSIIGGGLGSLVGSVVPGAGTAIGGIAGSVAGDWLGSKVGGLFSSQNSSNIKIADVNLSGKKVLEQDSDTAKQFSKMGVDGSAPVIVIDKADIKVKQEDGGMFSNAWDKIKGFFGYGSNPNYQGTGLGGTGLTGGGGLNAGSINRSRGGTGVIPNTDTGLTALSQKFETGGNIGNVSIDKNGGYSYGLTQFSDKQGSIQEYLRALQNSDIAGGKELAAKMQAAGTGTKEGKAAWENFYRNADAATKQQHKDFEENYAKGKFYNPNYNKIADSNKDLASMIDKSSTLQQVLYSTGVQHGGNSSEIFNQAYNKVLKEKGSVSNEDLLNAVYDNRLYGDDAEGKNKAAGNVSRFKSSSAGEIAGVVNRLGERGTERMTAFANLEREKSSKNVNTTNTNQPLMTLAKDSGVKLNKDGTIDVTTLPGYDSMQFAGNADISRMDPETATRMAAMSKQIYETTGIKPNFSEGYRDYNEQINTYRKYGPGRAATPGGSDHGTGTAFDFSESQVPQLEAALKAKGLSMEELGTKYGLKRTVNGESWHFAATDRQTQQMQLDKQNKQTGKRIGSDYLSANEKQALSKDSTSGDTQLAQEAPPVQSQTATAAANAANAATSAQQDLNTAQITPNNPSPSPSNSGSYQSTAQADSNSSTPVFYIDDPHVQAYRIDPLRPVA